MIPSSILGLIVLLGSPNMDTGELCSVAKERCERALKEYCQHPGYKILPTGGFGAHFNRTDKPHAFYLKQYLVARGVPESDILEFVLSRNTIEDVALSYPLVTKTGVQKVIVVTSDYHADRAQFLFQQTYKHVSLTFSLCATDEQHCELDLRALQAHEKAALARLRHEAGLG